MSPLMFMRNTDGSESISRVRLNLRICSRMSARCGGCVATEAYLVLDRGVVARRERRVVEVVPQVYQKVVALLLRV